MSIVNQTQIVFNNTNPFMRLCEYKKMYSSDIPSSEEIIQLHADLCSALADPRRILLIYALAKEPKNVGELTEEVGISQPSVSRHLKVLREAGLARRTPKVRRPSGANSVSTRS